MNMLKMKKKQRRTADEDADRVYGGRTRTNEDDNSLRWRLV